MRRQPRTLRIALPDGPVLLARLTCAAEAVVNQVLDEWRERGAAETMVDDEGRRTLARPLLCLAIAQRHFAELLRTGVVVGWESVHDAQGNPLPFRAAELDGLLEDAEVLQVVTALADAAQASPLRDAAAALGLDPTRPAPATMSATGSPGGSPEAAT
jgi:hypothetical protein